MSITKLKREKKRQMGQFLTPIDLADRIVGTVKFLPGDRILEPSMGDGSFIIPLIERFLPLYSGSQQDRLSRVLSENIWGVELDKCLYESCLRKIAERWGCVPEKHNLVQGDFFRTSLSRHFDYVIGNPPFGGSFDPDIEDELDATLGVRDGEKIKKETYAFFIVKSIDSLKRGGTLKFICSDTFLTINTMRGLRAYLMKYGKVEIQHLSVFSEETAHPMVVLSYKHEGMPGGVVVDSRAIAQESIKKTDNLSFGLREEFEKYFIGPRMGNFFIATSGMTTGKNEYFLRKICGEYIEETHEFSFCQAPVCLSDEIKKARLGKLSEKVVEEIRHQEAQGFTKRNVKIERIAATKRVRLPHPDYRLYNKAENSIIYSPPSWVIYWKNDGEAVKTYKKTGNWYLRGVGGQPYFFREGLTWQLIASRMHMRYLPPGYVFDSGAPCAFIRENVPDDELYFGLGWTLTHVCNRILKEVINHTKNIQSKDFERLPYPFWVSSKNKLKITSLMRESVMKAMSGKEFTHSSPVLNEIEKLFKFSSDVNKKIGVFLSKTNKRATLFS